jgi:hypothetical protein
MKTCLPICLLIAALLPFSLASMAGNEDVLYLKSGNIWRGQIIEYNDSICRIHLATDSVLTITTAEIQMKDRISEDYPLEYEYDLTTRKYIAIERSVRYYYFRHPGFFLQWQTNIGLIDGMRIVMGCRINTWFALGLGIGAEYGATLSTPAGASRLSYSGAPGFVYNSGYTPIFVYLTGDILKTRITPFYSLEAGYYMPWYKNLQTNPDDGAIEPPYSYYTNYGGPTAGGGIGLRIRCRNHCNITFSLNMNAGHVRIRTDAYQSFGQYTPGGPPGYYTSSTANYLMTQPSFRFSIGY